MRLAILQMQAKAGDVAANLARIERAAEDAAAQGAHLLVAPELAVTGYGAGAAMAALAEPANGPAARRLAALSARLGIALIVGFAERDGDTVWNSALYIDGNRPPVTYRKAHLYGPYERGLFAPASPTATVFDHRGVKTGMLICYDVEFPETVRRLAQAGAALVIVPTALPVSDHSELIARKMIPVRAFENQVFVAYANHSGADPLFSFAGLSVIAAPDGSLLAEAGEQGEALLIADIEPAEFAASAEANTYLRDLKG